MATMTTTKIPVSADGMSDGLDITPGQKMLSAMSGSLLTSLLGVHNHHTRRRTT